MLIALASMKGAPGVTTLALGLTVLWPQPGAVLVECDLAGGDLAARFGHHRDPGLASLAAAARTGSAQVALSEHAQRVAVGADVVLAPPGDGAAAAVHTLTNGGGDLLRRAGDDQPVLVDLGRLARGGPSLAVAAAADHLLVLTGAQLAEATQVQARLQWLRPELSGRLWLVRAAGAGYGSAELARALGVQMLWDLPHSRLGAGALTGQLQVPNWRRLKLARAIRGIATTLTTAQPASILPEFDPARLPGFRPVLDRPRR